MESKLGEMSKVFPNFRGDTFEAINLIKDLYFSKAGQRKIKIFEGSLKDFKFIEDIEKSYAEIF